MKRRWAALGIVLALSVFMPDSAEAQDTRSRKAGATLGQNYPNPFNPETNIPFSLGVEDTELVCQTGKQFRVSVRIYNAISQMVAVPVLKGGVGGVGGGQPLENVTLPCGQYVAFWSGKVLGTGREAASGVYLVRLEVDGKTVLTKKMLVTK
jgi:hypothetical protein